MKRIFYAIQLDNDLERFIQAHKGKYEKLSHVPTLFDSWESAGQVLADYYIGGGDRPMRTIGVDVNC